MRDSEWEARAVQGEKGADEVMELLEARWEWDAQVAAEQRFGA